MSTDPGTGTRWLVLVYQFPKGPGSRRVKIWRRLQRIGAVAIKNSMYVLPLNEPSREDFQWVLRELTADGAEGAILEAQLVDGMTDQEVRALFDVSRSHNYAEVIDELQAHEERLPKDDLSDTEIADARQAISRARKKLAEIEAIDFYGAPGRDEAERRVRELTDRISMPDAPANQGERAMQNRSLEKLKSRVWVTRQYVRVDRIASAWLIRTRIDPDAVFKFTADKDYEPGDREIRFDMYDGEFTHEGDLCTFEVLYAAMGIDDPALRSVAEIVHDIDLKDRKYEHPETQGIANLLEGLAAGTQDDTVRLERGGAIFDNLYRFFHGQPG